MAAETMGLRARALATLGDDVNGGEHCDEPTGPLEVHDEPAAPDPLEAAVARIDEALGVIGDDLEAGLADDVLEALALVRQAKPAKFMTLRAALRRANPDLRLGVLDQMVQSQAPAGDEQIGTVEALVETVRDMGELFLGTDDRAYVAFDAGGHREVWPLDSGTFRDTLSARFYGEHGRVPRGMHLTDALATLSGQARHAGERHDVELRVAIDPAGGYLIDIGDDAWRAVRVTARGWQVLDESPVRLRRVRGTGALPVPDPSGTAEDFYALVNVERADRELLVAAVLECYRPDTAYPVIEIGGEEGSAKSTTTENVRRLIDPNAVLLRAAPKAIEDVFVGARNNHVVAYNNLSHLPAPMQDALCTLSTGGGFAARKLYSDDDEAVYEAKRPAILNGISGLATQSDLLSRVVRIVCPRLEPENRLSDQAVAERFEALAPKAFGFLLNTLRDALALLPEITIRRPPRMMDFALFGEAVGRVLGLAPGAFTARYVGGLEDGAVQSLEGSPAALALMRYLDERGDFTDGTVGELLDALEQMVGPSGRDGGWPKSAKGFRDVLTKAAPALRLTGVTITYGESSGRRGRPVTVRRGNTFSLAEDSSPPNRPSPPSPPSPIATENRQCDGGDGRDGETATLETLAREKKSAGSAPSRSGRTGRDVAAAAAAYREGSGR